MIVLFEEPRREDGLGVPYPAMPENENFGFIYLKKNREQIPNVREIAERPELIAFVQAICAESSMFQTLRCGEFRHYERGPEFDIPVAEWYVTIAFDVLYYNTMGAFREFSEQFLTFLEQYPENERTLLFIKPIYTSFNDHGGWTGVTLDFCFRSYATTSAEAERQLFGMVKPVTEFLSHESSLWLNKLDPKLERIC